MPALRALVTACNGDRALCDRPLDEVVLPGAHNAMASADVPGWMFPNHVHGIPAQLRAGIRALLIDVYGGTPVAGRVKTDLSGEAARQKFDNAIGREDVDAALRIRDRLVGEPEGPRALYMCHGFCEIGAQALVPVLGTIRDFLVENPGEVLAIVIEDYVAPEEIAQAFEESGLLRLVYTGPVGPPWPTLREMIARDQRVLVFAEKNSSGVPWYHQAFEVMQETPYHFETPEELSCAVNRGGTAGSLFQINHWIDTTPTPEPSNAEIVNAREFLLDRARQCQAERGLLPNILAVDFAHDRRRRRRRRRAQRADRSRKGPHMTRATAIASLLSSASALSRGCAAPPPPDPDAGWVSLFDGQSLEGWKASENAESFTVADGAITCDGPRSHLFYVGSGEAADFRNFELETEVLARKGANSGIYFHTAFQEDDWPGQGFEIQVNNSQERHGDYLETKKTGSLYGYRNLYKAMGPDDEWFGIKARGGGQARPGVGRGHPGGGLPRAGRASRGLGRELPAAWAAAPSPSSATTPRARCRTATCASGPLADTRRRPGAVAGGRRDLHADPRAGQGQLPPRRPAHPPQGRAHPGAGPRALPEDGHVPGRRGQLGQGFPIETDEGVLDFLKKMEGQPVFVGMQAEGREWVDLISPEVRAEFDYVFTDSMTFTDDRSGKRTRLWMPDEVEVGDPQAFMDMLVGKAVGILENEPIDIYVNPTFLPEVIAADYDTLWTDARMKKVIDAAVRNDVAIEINARYKLPSERFLRMAKDAGAKFTIGTNNGGADDLGDWSYPLAMQQALELGWQDMYVPGHAPSRSQRELAAPERRAGLASAARDSAPEPASELSPCRRRLPSVGLEGAGLVGEGEQPVEVPGGDPSLELLQEVDGLAHHVEGASVVLQARGGNGHRLDLAPGGALGLDQLAKAAGVALRPLAHEPHGELLGVVPVLRPPLEPLELGEVGRHRRGLGIGPGSRRGAAWAGLASRGQGSYGRAEGGVSGEQPLVVRSPRRRRRRSLRTRPARGAGGHRGRGDRRPAARRPDSRPTR